MQGFISCQTVCRVSYIFAGVFIYFEATYRVSYMLCVQGFIYFPKHFAGFRPELFEQLFRPAADVPSLPRIAAEFADFLRGSGWWGRDSDWGCRHQAQYLGPHSGGVEDQASELLPGQFQVYQLLKFKVCISTARFFILALTKVKKNKRDFSGLKNLLHIFFLCHYVQNDFELGDKNWLLRQI